MPSTEASWDEPQELDSDNEAVITLYDGIKRILRNQRNVDEQSASLPERRTEQKKAKPGSPGKQTKHFLACMKILNVKVERRTVAVTLMKTSGEIVQLNIQAAED